MIHLRIAGDDEGGRGWLCPEDPRTTVTGGPEGANRLEDAGCLGLGPSSPVMPGTYWQTTFDLLDFQPAQLQGFKPGAEYMLLVVTGDDHSGGVVTSSTPPINLVP